MTGHAGMPLESTGPSPRMLATATYTGGNLAPAATTVRLVGLDAARFLAAAGIVWLHTLAINPAYSTAADLGRFAVPFFTVSAAALMVGSLRRNPEIRFPGYFCSRLQRLYCPFLAWTALYVLLRDLKCLAQSRAEFVPLGPYLFLIGSTHHLWFLPYLLSTSVLLFPLVTTGLRFPGPGKLVVLFLLLVAAVIAMLPTPVHFDSQSTTFLGRITYGGELGWDALPAAMIGAAVGLGFPAIQRFLAARRWLAMVLLAGFACSVAVTVAEGRHRLVETLSGLCLFLAAAVPCQNRVVAALGSLGQYAYGIYLVHVAFVLGFEALVVSRPRAEIGLGQLLGVFAASLAASTLACASFRRFTATRWLVP